MTTSATTGVMTTSATAVTSMTSMGTMTTSGESTTTEAPTTAPPDTTEGPITWFCQPLELEVPEVMLLVDRSKSMLTESMLNESHWDVTRTVVDTLLDQFGGNFRNLVATGLLSFPRPGIGGGEYATYCDVDELPEYPPTLGLDAWEGLGEEPMGGAAPLRSALEVAYGFLKTGEHARNAVVVFTDGAPNCHEDFDPGDGDDAFYYGDMEVFAPIVEARENGLRTFFVGIGTEDGTDDYTSGVEVQDWDSHGALTTLAFEGGTDDIAGDPYYVINSAESIDFMMSQLSRRLYCDVRLPHEAIDWVEELPIEFLFDGDLWSGVSDCTGFDGVAISNQDDGLHLNFCGLACDDLVEFGGFVEVCVPDVP